MSSSRPVISIVTTNSSKFSSYTLFFQKYDLEVEMLSAELYEPQSVDPLEIIRAKLSQAKEKFPGKMVFVDDRSLNIPALNNFPGPFLKLAISSLGARGFLKLMADEADRTMLFVTAMAFFDGQNDHFFLHEERGVMLPEMRGDKLRGWTEVLYIYAHESQPNRALAEYSDEEWQRHHDVLIESLTFIDQVGQLVSGSSEQKPIG